MSCSVALGSPASAIAANASSAIILVVAGCSGWPLAITGFPAATAAAKSPPDTAENANGKLFGPNTTTGPIAAKHDRLFALTSIVGSAHEPSSEAAAA